MTEPDALGFDGAGPAGLPPEDDFPGGGPGGLGPGPGGRRRARPAPARGFRLTGLLAVLVIIAVTAVGALLNGLAGGEPGLILDLSLIVGTVVAAVLVEDRLVWLLIPVPALVFPVMAFAAGVIGESGASSSHTGTYAVAKWVANGFIAMATATLLAGLMTVVRMSGRRS